jgi:hypothetical protein
MPGVMAYACAREEKVKGSNSVVRVDEFFNLR